MSWKPAIVGISAGILLSACLGLDSGDGKKETPGAWTAPARSNAGQPVEAITRDQADALLKASSLLFIDSSSVKGDSLIVWVNYGGGCREHLFAGYVSGYLLISEPAQRDFWIYHEDNGDLCKALVHERLAWPVGHWKTTPDGIFRVHGQAPESP